MSAACGPWCGWCGRCTAAWEEDDMDDFEDDPLTTEEDCPAHEDGQHCSCWYEGYECCACGAPALEDE